jgi:cytochrome c oxidase subunit 2
MLLYILTTTFLDAPNFWQIGFQDPATPIINGIIHFHNHLIYYLLVIGTFVVFLLFRAWILFKTSKFKTSLKLSKFTHSTPLEVIWTITPALLLVLIAGPSFALLYSIDEVVEPNISLKVIGHQWYWSYEYGDFFKKENGKTISFDSYIVGQDDLSFGGLRLLEVDHRVKLPIKQHIRVLVSSADVLHSWAVPSLGIKIDACPGRLNQVSLYLLRKGIFYGQCSEICGVNHGFMPIVVQSLEENDYFDWVKSCLIGIVKRKNVDVNSSCSDHSDDHSEDQPRKPRAFSPRITSPVPKKQRQLGEIQVETSESDSELQESSQQESSQPRPETPPIKPASSQVRAREEETVYSPGVNDEGTASSKSLLRQLQDTQIGRAVSDGFDRLTGFIEDGKSPGKNPDSSDYSNHDDDGNFD